MIIIPVAVVAHPASVASHVNRDGVGLDSQLENDIGGDLSLTVSLLYDIRNLLKKNILLIISFNLKPSLINYIITAFT